MKSLTLALLISTFALSAGCKTTGDFCDIEKPYRPQAAETYSEANKRRIVAFNEYGERHCGWKP